MSEDQTEPAARNVRVHAPEADWIRREAFERRTSAAEVVRDVIEVYRNHDGPHRDDA